MADPLALQTADGASQVSIADPTGAPIIAPLLEIGATQAIIETDVEFEPNAYLDLTLQLKGQPPRKFFAHVVAREGACLRIRWMHLDPGEEQKLKGLLAAYARTAGPGHGTRRVIKPKNETVTPFGAQPEVQMPAVPPEPPPHKGTRRVIRPGAKPAPTPDEPEEHAPTPAQPGEESRSLPVVIASTDKFEQLRHIEEAKPGPPAAAPQPTTGHSPILGAVPVGSEQVQPASGGSSRIRSIGKDGRMDVGAAIRSKAKTVRASELAARHDNVRVLNMATIKLLIQEAVEEAATHLTRALGESERKRLMEEAEDSFKERLKAFELDKKDAEEKARVLQKDLSAARELLEQERKRSIAADQFTVSEAGLAEIDVRMATIIQRAVSRGEAGPDLELKLREMIAHILDTEREKLKEKELSAHNDKIALLEKKVARLAHSLDSTEKERDEARQIADLMARDGLSYAEVKNKYKIGLDGDDPNRERKLALMRELVEQNRELRKALGIQTRDPEEVAREQADEDKTQKAEADAAKREALGLDEPPAAPESEPEGVEPTLNPDDEVWEAPPASAPTAAEDDRGVKILRDFKKTEPPPLQIIDRPGENDDVLVDPDDQPWDGLPVKAPGT